MEIIYRANDGVIFDNEWDCQEHEVNIKFKDVKNSNEIHMYNDEGAKCIELDGCFYIKVDTDRAREYVEYLSNEMGLSVPDDFDIGVCYYYDKDYDYWRNLDVEMGRLKKIEKIFQK